MVVGRGFLLFVVGLVCFLLGFGGWCGGGMVVTIVVMVVVASQWLVGLLGCEWRWLCDVIVVGCWLLRGRGRERNRKKKNNNKKEYLNRVKKK